MRVDLRRRRFGGGFPGGFGGGGGRPAAAGSTSPTSSATCSTAAAAVGAASAAPAAGRRARPRAPTSRPRRRSRFADAVDGTTLQLRLSSDAPCPTCSGTGGKPGTRPHVCATCDGAGVVISSVGGGFSMNETCPECHGRQLVYDEACPTCHGSGRGLSSRTISARIPAGVKDGQQIRLKGKGAAGENGGPAGDLFVVVHVARATSSSAARATTSPSTCRSPSTRPRSAPRSRCRRWAARRSPCASPPGTPNGRVLRVRGRGVAAQGRLARATCWSPSTSRCRPRSTTRSRAAVDAYREARDGRRPAGRPVPGRCLMATRGAGGRAPAYPARPCRST